MAAVCNFSNLLTLIIFNGFSLQANRRERKKVPALLYNGAPVTHPGPWQRCKFFLSELLVRDNHSAGNYFLIYEINEMLN